MRIGRTLLAVSMLVSVASCTLVLPTTFGLSAHSHNARVDARRAAGESSPGRKQDVGARVVAAVFGGFALDVAMIALIGSGYDDNGLSLSGASRFAPR